MNQAEIRALMSDRVAQRLVQAPIHARLAYTAKDGSPRVIPIGFIWNGDVFVMGSPPIAPKVKALSANPKVALTIDTEDFPPNILLVRGEAALETVDGVPDEFIEAARRFVGDERMPEWEAGARGLYKQMVLIRITPTWAKIIDFETRLPRYVEELTSPDRSREVGRGWRADSRGGVSCRRVDLRLLTSVGVAFGLGNGVSGAGIAGPGARWKMGRVRLERDGGRVRCR
jgi:hypothetical protein